MRDPAEVPDEKLRVFVVADPRARRVGPHTGEHGHGQERVDEKRNPGERELTAKRRPLRSRVSVPRFGLHQRHDNRTGIPPGSYELPPPGAPASPWAARG